MRKRPIKTFIALALCAVMVLAVGGALASGLTITFKSGFGVTSGSVAVKSAPGAGYSTLGTLPAGTTVRITGLISNGWVQVDYGGASGYIAPGGVSLNAATTVQENSGLGTYYTLSTVNAYSSPSTASTVLFRLSAGQQVYKCGYVGDWAQLKINGVLCYVEAAKLVRAFTAGGSSAPVGGELVNSANATHVVTAANLNVRSGPSTSYSKLGTLVVGSTVTKVGSTGNWSKIFYGTGYGYVYSSYIKAISGASTSGTAQAAAAYVVTAANLNVRSGPSTSYSKLGSVLAGTVVTKVGSSGNWSKIAYGTGYGYVYSKYIQPVSGTAGSAAGSTTGGTASGVIAYVYSGPGTGYTVVGTIKAGEKVTQLGVHGDWVQITNGVITGYVPMVLLYGASQGTATGVYAVDTEQLNVRSGPGTGYGKLGVVKKGQLLTIIGFSGKWAMLTFNGMPAYVHSGYLNPVSVSGSTQTLYIFP